MTSVDPSKPAFRRTLGTFERIAPEGTPLTAQEVADEIGCTRRTAHNRLTQLEEEGYIETKKVGARGRVWWLPRSTDETEGDILHPGLYRSLVDAVKEYAIFMLDADGYVQSWNEGAKKIKGYDREEIVGEHFSTFYTEEDVAAGVAEDNLAEAAAEGTATDEGWRVRKDGSRFWANVTITRIDDDDGSIRGFTKVTRDMTERHEQEERLRRERELTRQVLRTAPVPLAVLDDEGEVVLANERAESLVGLTEGSLVEDREELTVYDEAGDPVAPEEMPAARALRAGETVTDEEIAVERDDGRRWFAASASPVDIDDGDGDSDGESGHIVVADKEITSVKAEANRLKDRLDELFDRVSDGFFVVDEEWRFTYVNRGAEEMIDVDRDEVRGENLWEVFEAARGTTFEEEYVRAMETQEPVSFVEYFAPLETWFEVNAYPSESGLSVYFQDVTRRVERERELGRYKTVVDTLWDGVYALGPDEEFVMVNEAFAEMTGYDREELLGEPATLVHSDDVNAEAREIADAVDAEGRAGGTVEFELRTADGGSIPAEARLGPYAYDGDRRGRTGVVRDITERKRYEKTLESLHGAALESMRANTAERVDEVLVETLSDALDVMGAVVYRLDDEETLRPAAQTAEAAFMRHEFPPVPVGEGSIVGRTYADGETRRYADIRESPQLSVDPDDTDMRGGVFVPMGDHGLFVVGSTEADAFDEQDQRLLELMGTTAEAAYDRVDYEESLREQERQLALRVEQQEAVSQLGQQALKSDDIDQLMRDASRLVASVLGNDYCKVLELRPEENELLLRQGVGWNDGIVGDATVASDTNSQAGYTLQSRGPVIVDDLDAETRFSGPDLLTDHGVASGISVVIGAHDEPWGILGTHDTDEKEFTERDANFVQSVANVLATALDRHYREQALAEQRERLAALNNLNRVVRDTTEAVINKSTREEIERTVCQALAVSDSYEFAWVADVDPATNEIRKRTEAGVDGYLESVSLSTDPEEATGRGPTGRAIHTHEMQVTHDVLEDPDFEPWREQAREYGYRSTACIPLVHEGTLYGLLGVYADRPGAFEGEEGRLVGQLGEIVSHAIGAVDRKRALMSDDVLEVSFEIRDIFEAVGITGAVAGTIEMDRTLPVGDGDYLVYGRASEAGIETIERIVDALPHWQSAEVLGDRGEETRFEVRLAEPPVASLVASLGGRIHRAKIDEGNYRMTVHLPASADVRRLVDGVKESYPDAEVLAQRQNPQTDDTEDRLSTTVLERLTERQRTVIESAFFAGFFEWPRESSGEDLADSLDISGPTFHQHMRAAQRKLLTALFTDR